MVKRIQGWDISSKLHNKHKVYVCLFSSAKAKSMKDYSKACIKEDKPDHFNTLCRNLYSGVRKHRRKNCEIYC